MSHFFKSASKTSRSLIGPTLATLFLAGCSFTPNNSALLLETPSQVALAATPRVKPLPSAESSYGQTVEADSQTVEADVTLEEGIVEANDPGENFNRKINSFNTGVDKVVIRPLSKVYGAIIPSPVRLIIKNGLRHLEAPGDLINYTLQGNGQQAGKTLQRFVINSTLGLGGAFDAAGHYGIDYNPTDFGLTLADWGVGEGRYIVTPFFGPGTIRDGFGRFVDIGLRPQSYIGVITDFNYGGAISSGVETVDRRHRNGDLLDNVIFASPDPYVTLRSTYLQRRRSLASGNVIGADGMEEVLPVIATAGE